MPRPVTDRSEYDDRNTDEPSSVITLLPHMHAVQSLRSDRASVPLGCCGATELEPKLFRYRPSVRSAQSLRSDRARAKARSLRSDRTLVPLCRHVATELEPKLGRYVATEPKPKLGRYVATEHSSRSVATSRNKRFKSEDGAKVDQLLKGNQSQVFIMEEATPEKSAGDLAFEAELSGDDQQEVSYVNGQGWQLKNYHPNPNVRNNQQLFWPKQDKPTDHAQSNQG
ncbi:hypothetical protein F2Q69_00008038 [Brassica cretica]|uniref:Uncharacterized protein n=1 Tax=Brassica cretica TaxID=69181 RepID=A0A8S9NXX7_BRACR|nr:hypothetical protein F2Q69_00008038 [Brassica cretica]